MTAERTTPTTTTWAEAPRSEARPQLHSRLRIQESLVAYAFLLPWLLGFFTFIAAPMVFSLYASFTEYNLISSPEWVGIENYETIFTNDRWFVLALMNTLWIVVLKVPFTMLISLVTAILMNRKLVGNALFRTIIYLPNVLSGVAAIFLWRWILESDGLFNTALAAIGIDGPAWFSDPAWTKPGIVIMGLWWIGSDVLIFLAGLKGIPQVLYEAAEIDGATILARIRHITLPLLTPTIFFILITGIISAFQIFTTAYILIPQGQQSIGGPGSSLLFYVLYLYNMAFGRMGTGGLQMGYASALAWILFAIVLIVTLIQLRLSRRWVHYEND